MKGHLTDRQKVLISLTLFVLLRVGFWLRPLSDWLHVWEEEIFWYFVPPDHLLRRVDAAIDFEQIGRICESKYSGKTTVIPRIEPIKLFKLYLVMFLYGIYSERELCRRAHSDLAIRWFCGFGLWCKIADHSTLSRFRTRLGAEAFREIFRYIVRLCVEAKLVKGDHISIDGSKFPACASRYPPAQQARRLVKEFMRKAFGTEYVEGKTERDEKQLKELEKCTSKLVGYPLKESGGILRKIRKEAKLKGEEIVRVGEIALGEVKELREKLKELLSKIPHAMGDIYARIGRTSSNENYCGYLMSFALEHPSGIFTACDLDSGDTYCSELFTSTYEEHKRNLEGMQVCNPPSEISLDKGYDEARVRECTERDGVKAYISLCRRENKYGVYSTEMFEFNKGGELICPAGKLMERMGKKLRKDRKVRFRGTGCIGCELRHACTTVDTRIVEIIPEEHLRRQEARQASQTPEHKEAMKKRLAIERGLGHLKGYHLLGKALYRSKEMARIQQLVSATASNMEKLVQATYPLR